MALPLEREVRILCSARQNNDNYLRHEIIFDAGHHVGYVETEEKLQAPSLDENVRLIKDYSISGKTNNELFDRRIKATGEGFRQAIVWLEQNIK